MARPWLEMAYGDIVMLFYDILLTFGEEVERIWMKKFSHFTVLWFLVKFWFLCLSHQSTDSLPRIATSHP